MIVRSNLAARVLVPTVVVVGANLVVVGANLVVVKAVMFVVGLNVVVVIGQMLLNDNDDGHVEMLVN